MPIDLQIEMQPMPGQGEDILPSACNQLSEKDIQSLLSAKDRILSGETYEFDFTRLTIFLNNLGEFPDSRSLDFFLASKRVNLEAQFKRCLESALFGNLSADMCNNLILMLDIMKNSENQDRIERKISKHSGYLSDHFFENFGMPKEDIIALHSTTRWWFTGIWVNTLYKASLATSSCCSGSPPKHS